MKRILAFVSESELVKAILTLIVYCFNAAVIGVSLAPSVYLLARAWKAYMLSPTAAHVIAFSIACGCALFLYFITGSIVMSLTIRLISLGMKAGRYPMVSFTMLRWLIYSGVYHLAGKTILEYLPISFLSVIFFRIVGAKIGKNVAINSWFLNDAYLLELGDNVVIGGKSDISCHTFEKNTLLLSHVRIGRNTLVGQQCYISPGVSIGENCVIGQYSFIRKNKDIPDRTVIAALGGLPIRIISKLEKMGEEAVSGLGTKASEQ
ncbi:MAG TPA: DapH/DapD/GlmU-related protein [Chitinivibrionales bacterium]|nr:DapH/DapD/GlmU-related protein [Chitinivibrionales bacterium]